jgi:nitrite reductase (NADH) small subunit
MKNQSWATPANVSISHKESTMTQALPTQKTTQWVTVCSVEAIHPNMGVCALVEGEQIAIFRLGKGTEIFAISNYDPFSRSFVLSRGLVGDRKGTPKVASPIYKQNFCLATGRCLDDETVSIPTFPTRIVEGQVQVGVSSADPLYLRGET